MRSFLNNRTERERISVTNIASTMAAMVSSQPLLPALDLSSLRIASCGGSPQPPVVVRCATFIRWQRKDPHISYGKGATCGGQVCNILYAGSEKHSPH